WTPTSMVNVPIGRFGYTAVWTGSEMIIWGGEIIAGPHCRVIVSSFGRVDGARGRPTVHAGIVPPACVHEKWGDVAPSVRAGHTAVWTGDEMIIWSGGDGQTLLNTGGRYCAQPSAMPRLAPSPRPRPTPAPRP